VSTSHDIRGIVKYVHFYRLCGSINRTRVDEAEKFIIFTAQNAKGNGDCNISEC